jgi:hypothetical protein
MIFQGTAAMECPLCGGLVTHTQWSTPLQAASAKEQVVKVMRDVIQAARWSNTNSGRPLAAYLKTSEGQVYSQMWTPTEVQKADQHVMQNP